MTATAIVRLDHPMVRIQFDLINRLEATRSGPFAILAWRGTEQSTVVARAMARKANAALGHHGPSPSGGEMIRYKAVANSATMTGPTTRPVKR